VHREVLTDQMFKMVSRVGQNSDKGDFSKDDLPKGGGGAPQEQGGELLTNKNSRCTKNQTKKKRRNCNRRRRSWDCMKVDGNEVETGGLYTDDSCYSGPGTKIWVTAEKSVQGVGEGEEGSEILMTKIKEIHQITACEIKNNRPPIS